MVCAETREAHAAWRATETELAAEREAEAERVALYREQTAKNEAAKPADTAKAAADGEMHPAFLAEIAKGPSANV